MAEKEPTYKIEEEEEKVLSEEGGKCINTFRLRYPGRQYPTKTSLLRGEEMLDDILNRLMEDEHIITSLNFAKTLSADDVRATFTFLDMPKFERQEPELKIIKRKLSNVTRVHAFIRVKDVKVKFGCPVSLLFFPYVGTGYIKIEMIRILLAVNISEDRVKLESLKGDNLNGVTLIMDPCNILFRNRVNQKVDTLLNRHKEVVKDAIVHFLKKLFEKYFCNYSIPEI